jgi:hypothetical protein
MPKHMISVPIVSSLPPAAGLIDGHTVNLNGAFHYVEGGEWKAAAGGGGGAYIGSTEPDGGLWVRTSEGVNLFARYEDPSTYQTVLGRFSPDGQVTALPGLLPEGRTFGRFTAAPGGGAYVAYGDAVNYNTVALQRVGADGSELWLEQLPSVMNTSPHSIHADADYVVVRAGTRMAALDHDGEVVWSKNFNGDAGAFRRVTLRNGRLYAVTADPNTFEHTWLVVDLADGAVLVNGALSTPNGGRAGDQPQGLVVTSTHVVLVTRGRVEAYSRAGGDPTTLATGSSAWSYTVAGSAEVEENQLWADSEGVYFSTPTDLTNNRLWALDHAGQHRYDVSVVGRPDAHVVAGKLYGVFVAEVGVDIVRRLASYDLADGSLLDNAVLATGDLGSNPKVVPSPAASVELLVKISGSWVAL